MDTISNMIIPAVLKNIYPNPVVPILGTPAVVFRDHRWTLPVLYLAGLAGLVTLPVVLVTFDRHRDALDPVNGAEKLSWYRESGGTFDDLIKLVKHHLSPRDDDWITSGMELGLISDAVQFSTDPETTVGSHIVKYTDSDGTVHRLYRLGRPVDELSYKRALTDKSHSLHAGLCELLGWNPSSPGSFASGSNIAFDLDCDFFTFSWETYIFPFSEEVFTGELNRPCQSHYYEGYQPVSFIKALIRAASIMTVATEPDFCGGADKSQAVFSSVNRRIFDAACDGHEILVDYPPVYPSE